MANEYLTNFNATSDVMELFEFANDIENAYLFSKLQYGFKAMTISKKTSLRVNEAGILALQYLIPVDSVSLFVELYILPMAD